MPPLNQTGKLPGAGSPVTSAMSIEEDRNHVVFKLVLTGGPCSGKTTGQARLSTFLENYGWKVYRVPETAAILLGGGVRFPDLNEEQVENFQENLLLTMMAIEKTFFDLAHSSNRNCVVICDRGTMDPSAFIERSTWNRIIKRNGFNEVDLRDNRYNQIVHLVSAAKGAEKFYSIEDNVARTEDLELARTRDDMASKAWVGHPYIEVIDNSTDFDTKMRRLIDCVCRKIGVDLGDRLAPNSRKIKFLVKSLPDDDRFPAFQDFDVVHDYLISPDPQRIQSRLRKRGQNGHWSYTYTQRKRESPDSQVIELKRTISHRDYINMLGQRDPTRLTVFKRRRCFIWNNYSFQLDIYKQPCNPRCEGLIILEVYTSAEDTSKVPPDWLSVSRDVTNDPQFSMYNLSKVEMSGAQPVLETVIMTNSFFTSNNALSNSPDECTSSPVPSGIASPQKHTEGTEQEKAPKL